MEHQEGKIGVRVLPPSAPIFLILLYLVVISLLLVPIDYALGRSDWIDIILLPMVEESLKLLIAWRYPKHVFSLIVILGLAELALAKGPILLSGYGEGDFGIIAMFSFLACAFHASTALAYSKAGTRRHLCLVYVGCVAAHVLYNMQATFVDSLWLGLGTTFAVMLLPLAFAAIARRHRVPSAG